MNAVTTPTSRESGGPVRGWHVILTVGVALLFTGCGAVSHMVNAQTEARAALQHLSADRYDEALRHADRAVAAAPEIPDLWVVRAQILSALDRHDDAERDLHRAATLAPDHPGVALQRALALDAEGNQAEAREIVSRAKARNPQALDLAWVDARWATEARAYDEAEQAYSRLIERADRDRHEYRVGARVGRALVRGRTSTDDGVEDYLTAVRLDLETAMIAATSFTESDLAEVLVDVADAASRAAPEDLAVGVAHAGVLQMSREFDRAVAEAERVLALEPDAKTAIRVRLIAAAADAACMRFASARRRLREALDLDPHRADAVIMLAEAVFQGRGSRADYEDLTARIDSVLTGDLSERERLFLEGIASQLHAEMDASR